MHTISAGLIYHHTAILVKDMQAAADTYSAIFGSASVSQVYAISSQQVSVCFINTGNGAYIELVEPFKESNAFDAYFKRGIHYYHVAYKTNNFEQAIEKLAGAGYKLLTMFNSEAFNNKRCAFLVSGLTHLTEIIEA